MKRILYACFISLYAAANFGYELRKTVQYLLIVMGVVLVNATFAQTENKPNSSTRPTATSTLPSLSYLGTDKINYVRTFDFLKPMTSDATLATEIANNNVIQATQYFDGLGRPVQTVARKASGSGNDLVTFMMYDQYGRQIYQPMPYVKTGSSNGAMQLNPTTDQNSFLTGHYSGESIFYGKTDFESSPLNRTLKQMAPGNSWAGNNTGVSMAYGTNTTAEGIRLWTLGTTPTTTSTYSPDSLLAAEKTLLVS